MSTLKPNAWPAIKPYVSWMTKNLMALPPSSVWIHEKAIVYKYHAALHQHIATINQEHVKDGGVNPRAFDQLELATVKDLLRLMNVTSNKCGKLRIENEKWVVSSSSRESRQPTLKTARVSASLRAAAAPAEDTTPTPLPQPNVLFPTSSWSRRRHELVDSTASCLLTDIDVVTESGAVNFMKISNLASLELIFDIYRKGYG
jgi:hypothetical protein